MSLLQNLSSEFNLETCHQVSAVIHESIVGVTRDIQVEEETLPGTMTTPSASLGIFTKSVMCRLFWDPIFGHTQSIWRVKISGHYILAYTKYLGKRTLDTIF